MYESQRIYPHLHVGYVNKQEIDNYLSRKCTKLYVTSTLQLQNRVDEESLFTYYVSYMMKSSNIKLIINAHNKLVIQNLLNS